MFGRLVVMIAMVLFGPLYIEIYLYHPTVVRAHDLAAIVPLVASPLGLFGGFLLMAVDNRLTALLFAAICAIEIAVGVAGSAIHIALHRPDPLLSVITDPTVWFGEPPPLVPLSFAASGGLGMIALVMPSRRQLDAPPVAIARILEAMAAVCGLASAGMAAFAETDAYGLIAAIAALGLGSFGFLAEIVTVASQWWQGRGDGFLR